MFTGKPVLQTEGRFKRHWCLPGREGLTIDTIELHRGKLRSLSFVGLTHIRDQDTSASAVFILTTV